jgi:hypothetical protein
MTMHKTGDRLCRDCFACLVPLNTDPANLACPNGHEKAEPVVVDSKRNVKATTLPAEQVHDLGFGGCSAAAGSDRLYFGCPGCAMPGSIRVGHPKPSGSPSWDVGGGSLADPTTLTLSPSINCVVCCGWHGYLRNGVFESC